MKLLITTLILSISVLSFGQSEYQKEFQIADSLLQANEVEKAYEKFKNLESSIPKTDTLYDYSLWYHCTTASHLEHNSRMKEDFQKSLELGLEAYNSILKGKEIFDDEFAQREYFMLKNIIVSQFGLKDYKEALKWKKKMYEAKQKKQLPEGIDQYFNFDFFTFEEKNIWGYEWFPELGDPETEGSYSKIVYYVYSTDENGQDKEQLYRLHVLKVHKIDNETPDYVLTKRLETAKNEVSGTLWSYTYDSKIDYKKLREDIEQVLKGNYEVNATTKIKKKN